MNLKNRRKIIFSLWGGTLVFCVLGLFINNDIIRGFCLAFGCISFLTSMTVILVYWRCPNCRAHLPTPALLTMHCCPFCGEDLNL